MCLKLQDYSTVDKLPLVHRWRARVRVRAGSVVRASLRNCAALVRARVRMRADPADHAHARTHVFVFCEDGEDALRGGGDDSEAVEPRFDAPLRRFGVEEVLARLGVDHL
eukprot:6182516-Pleurochrysis_carterae.AAC.2